ncbi:MAG: very short patch repair endonuclease [Verrucomicrobiota bacterium]
MVDKLTTERRSWTMSRVRSGNTKPELIVRSLLHRCGLRFTLRRRDLPGKPDVVLPKYHAAIFVHGCFWHRHSGCPRATTPSTQRDFWERKFARTVERDQENEQRLREQGWRVFVVWECEVTADPRATVRYLIENIAPERAPGIRYDTLPDRRETLRVAEQRLHWQLRATDES